MLGVERRSLVALLRKLVNLSLREQVLRKEEVALACCAEGNKCFDLQYQAHRDTVAFAA